MLWAWTPGDADGDLQLPPIVARRCLPCHSTSHATRLCGIRGIAAQTILLAFQLAHANRRKIRKWLDTLALGGERPRRRTHHRRQTKERKTWTPTGHLTPAA
ncbi:hypothetical protein [Streptomyces sp. NPDC058086]|uniref:hypothetical protein n=1 Tax=Streptomyces sp. NPDC058086 TaxID=3346334 RepID=UPI0036EBABB6